jgi:AcrR family transcriptional regulator
MYEGYTGITRPFSANREDIATDCMIDLLAEGGRPAVTLRTLADRIGVTPSGLLRWFGSADRMWETIAARYGQRWVDLLDAWSARTSARD